MNTVRNWFQKCEDLMKGVTHVSKQQKCDKMENVLEKIIENIVIIFLIKKKKNIKKIQK